MAKYPFLSPEWVTEARRIYAEAEATGALSGQPPPVAARVNLVVTDAPFSATPVDAHVDTSAGRVAIDTGHLPDPDVTVSLEYVTARSLFVSGDASALVQAFLSGRIKVDGDLTKLLDPRSGIWPGTGGAGGAGGLSLFAEPKAAGGWQQPGLGAGPGEEQQVAARLQAITE